MFNYLTANSTERYIDALPSITESYNRSKHRTTKMRSIDVDPDNIQEEKFIFHNTYGLTNLDNLLHQLY